MTVTDLTVAALQSRIEQLQDSSAYDEVTRSAALENYRRALVNLATVERQLEEMRQRYERARSRLDVAGISQALGHYLAHERHELPGAVSRLLHWPDTRSPSSASGPRSA